MCVKGPLNNERMTKKLTNVARIKWLCLCVTTDWRSMCTLCVNVCVHSSVCTQMKHPRAKGDMSVTCQ